MLGREYGRGRDVLGKVLDEDPNFVIALWGCAHCCAGLSLHDQAVAHLQRLVGLTDRLPLYVGMLGQMQAHAGRRAEAEALLRELVERLDGEYVPTVTLSWIAKALGEADHAFDWLEQEYANRGVWMYTTRAWPGWDDFRADPRFQALLRKMNFPAQA